MPVTGNEETALKPISQQFSDYISGVPIKKRRFPLIQPSSPQSEERCTFHNDNGSVQREKDSNILSVSILTAVGMSVVEKKFVSGESKEVSELSTNLVCDDDGFSKMKLEEPGIVGPPAHVDCVSQEEKPVMTDRPAHRILIDKTDLKVSPKDLTAENVGTDVNKEMQTEGKFKSEVSSSPTLTLLSLDLEQHRFPVLAAERNNENCHHLENLDPEFIPSSSSIKSSFKHCENAGVKGNTNSSLLQSNRANWDLNTTMDSWAGCDCEAPAMKPSVSQMTSTTCKHDMKPLLCSTGMAQTGILSHRQVPLNSKFGTGLMSSKGSSEQLYMPKETIHLCLSSKFPPHFSQDSSTSSDMLDSGSFNSNLIAPRMVEKRVSPNMVVDKVKSEPFEESVKIDCESDGRTINHQLSEQGNLGMPKTCSNSTKEKLGNARSIKSESVEECKMDMHRTMKGLSIESEKKVLLGNVLHTSTVLRPTNLELGLSSSKTSWSTGFSVSAVVNHSENTDESHISSEVFQEACEGTQVKVSVVPLLKDGDPRKQEVLDQGTVKAKNENTDGTAVLKIEFIDEPHNLCASRDGSLSDDEKIDISADILEDSYGSDYESDVNQGVAEAVEADDDDYEDGEVREPVASSKVEGTACERREIEDLRAFESDDKKMNVASPSGQDPISFFVDKAILTGEPDKTSNANCKDYLDSITCKSADCENKDLSLLEPVAAEQKINVVDVKRHAETTQRRLDQYDQSGKRKTLNGKEKSADQVPELVSVVTVVHSADEDVKKVDSTPKIDLASAIVEASVNSDDVAKDASGCSGSNVSRIIKLPRGSSTSLPGKTRSFSGRSFPLPSGRERLEDMSLKRRKLHLRGRDDFHIDGSQKFSRERNRDRSPRNSRNALQDRRRFNHKEDNVRGDWDCDSNYNQNMYNSPSEYHVSRQKYVPGFHHVHSRRNSPGDRDGFTARGLQMVRGVNRNFSSSQRVGEDGSGMAGERRNEKFYRDFRDDTMDTVFTHAQPPFEEVDGHFGRASRNFSSIQGDLSRVRSKSPMRSRSRSPGPWLSPIRSPDVFGEHIELTHPRSSMYRMERMRSPDRSCFRGEMAVRRHGSPSIVSSSNSIRDIDSGRANGHLRSAGPDRSPSGRFLVRNRRFDVMDHRERTNNDEYFDRLVHPDQFEFNDGNGDERRRFADRRHVRCFRPPSDGDDANFHVNSEDGSRPFRYFPEDDMEFHERASLREREFGRRVTNRLGNLPRRTTRSMEEDEANYRRCDQVRCNDNFGDISRMKRKRF